MTFPAWLPPSFPSALQTVESGPGRACGMAVAAGSTASLEPSDPPAPYRQTARNSAFRPVAKTAVSVPTLPFNAPNSVLVQQYNAGLVTATDVLRATSQLVRDNATDWPAAQVCLEALKSAVHPVTGRGIEPNTITYNVAMSTCGRWGLVEDAVRWFNDMLQRRITPDAQCYSTAIHCCRNGGRPDLALGLFQHMIEHGPRHGVLPTTELANVVLSGCEKSGQIEEVLGLFDYLVKNGSAFAMYPDHVTCNTVIWACGKAGRLADARRVFDWMQKARGFNAVLPELATYNAILAHCPRAAVPELLAAAIAQGIMRPQMGLDAARNRLNFHSFAVMEDRPRGSERSCYVHPDVGRAIFHDLARRGLINEQTRFVIGVQGSDKLETAISQCMLEQGWTPCHPTVDAAGKVFDFGMLANAGSAAAPSMELDPDAAMFQPGGLVAAGGFDTRPPPGFAPLPKTSW
jgi:pentatricopeptide repeat protein